MLDDGEAVLSPDKLRQTLEVNTSARLISRKKIYQIFQKTRTSYLFRPKQAPSHLRKRE